jgi:phosphoadenosine phosphosulfate reductase
MIEHVGDLRHSFGQLDGLALLRALLRDSPLRGQTALVSSFGAESAVLLDMIATVDPATPVLFLETGKLFDETLDYRDELVAHLGLTDVRSVRPAPADLLKNDRDGTLHAREPDLCCQIRKTEPLWQALDGFQAWITGRKRFHGNLRHALPTIEGEVATGKIKLNPLARWSAEDIERYRILRDLPAHPLVAEGYRSIGCAPCTRPTPEGGDARAGRWWGIDKTECGIHGDGI